MTRAKRIGLNHKRFCRCPHAIDGEKRLSKRKEEYLRIIRTGAQVRNRPKLKVEKEGHPVKKKAGPQPVKHYVNLPRWVVKNLIEIYKKPQERHKSKQKNPPKQSQSMESVKQKPRKEKQSQKKNLENEQVSAEVMKIKREMATTTMRGFPLRATCILILATLLVLAFKK